MTDSELKKIGNMMDKNVWKLTELVDRIKSSNREDKEEIINRLIENQIVILSTPSDILRDFYD